MVRPAQLLHPAHTPVTPRPAATLLLLRPSANGFEVLMTRRSAQASFAPNAHVFPGGAIDAADAELCALSSQREGQSPRDLQAAVAALRETFEELGVLLARDGHGQWVNPQQVRALDRHASLTAPLHTLGLQLAGAEVFPLCHWTTDRDLPKRFDVPFLVAMMPPGQEPDPDNREQFEPVWVEPAKALADHTEGRFFMIFPTIRTLERLVAYPSAEAVIDACRTHGPLFSSTPRAGWLRGEEARYMESDPPYGELELVCPDGQLLHPLDWDPTRPTPLLRHVQRLTAPNPGVMTGPGTNTYIVGQRETGFGVIDPGPDDPVHLERIVQATSADIRWIFCTHSHPDHSPGAFPLQSMVAARRGGRPTVWGLPSASTARSNSQFAPDQTIQDQEQLILFGQATGGYLAHHFRAFHTPGHAANHVCLVLEEDGLLFSGDHILNGSTTVIDPPDGNMDAYLHALDRLGQACQDWHITHILPAHGYVLGQAPAAIAQLKAHRLTREAKVLAALRALPDGSTQDWVRLVYGDVPQRLWPVAERSLLAHLERIRTLQLT